MNIPIEGDKIRIRVGERVLEETCFASAADLARAPDGRLLSILTKRFYRLGSHYRLIAEDGPGLAALVHSIQVPKWNAFHRVTFSLTMLAEE